MSWFHLWVLVNFRQCRSRTTSRVAKWCNPDDSKIVMMMMMMTMMTMMMMMTMWQYLLVWLPSNLDKAPLHPILTHNACHSGRVNCSRCSCSINWIHHSAFIALRGQALSNNKPRRVVYANRKLKKCRNPNKLKRETDVFICTHTYKHKSTAQKKTTASACGRRRLQRWCTVIDFTSFSFAL